MRIPNATYREAILLTAVSYEHEAVVVEHAPVPGVARTELGRTPPATAAAYAEDTTVEITFATRKGRKVGRVIQGKVAADSSGGAVSSPVGGSSKGFGYI